MENNEDLIQALLQEGIEPTEEARVKLDGEITELAEFLIDYWAFRQAANESTGRQRPDDRETIKQP